MHDDSEIDASEEKIRVALVDDHEIVRIGLSNMIERQPDMQVTVDVGSADEALARIPGQADVVVLDIRLGASDGLSVLKALKEYDPNVKVIMLTSFGGDDLVLDALMGGASGYLLKESRGRSVIDAIRTVASGGSLFGPQIAEKLLARLRQPSPVDPLAVLSPQEQKILALIAQGKTNKEIGQDIFLSEKTVKHYVSNILSKLGYTRRSEAAAFFAQHRLEGPE
ncbi:MAG: response regulator [Sulfobacillus sp.]